MKKAMLAVVALPFMTEFLAVLVTLLLMSAVPASAQDACKSPNAPGYMGHAQSGMPVPSTFCGYAAGVATTNPPASPNQPVAVNDPKTPPGDACSSPNAPGYIGNGPSGMPAPSTYCGYAAGVATSNPPAKSTNFGAR